MRFVQAQFSLKYEVQPRIRRFANDIEDFLCQHYGMPQVVPIPDDFAPEIPRIVLYSKNGHSQISFSQVSVDFTVKFDSDFVYDFNKTREYILKRIELIVKLLNVIDIKDYLFCGVTYNTRLDIGDQKPMDFICDYLGENLSRKELYEASRNIAYVKEEKFFVNQQISTYKEFQGRQGLVPVLFEIENSTLISEGVSMTLDINNRYQYIYTNKKNSINDCFVDVDKLFSLLADSLNEWE